MTRNAEGRYMTFSVAQREYGVEIQKVREILEPSVLEPLANPSTPTRWVVRLRNRVVPVVDMGRCFGSGLPGAYPHQCILTVTVRGWDGPLLMGLLVDGVREVIQVWSKDLEENRLEPMEAGREFLLGAVHYQDREVTLLDVEILANELEIKSRKF